MGKWIDNLIQGYRDTGIKGKERKDREGREKEEQCFLPSVVRWCLVFGVWCVLFLIGQSVVLQQSVSVLRCVGRC